MKVGSLFTGIAGLDRAVHNVFGARPAWFCEVEPWPAKVLERHYPHVPNLGDVTKVDWSQVEPVDIICGGFPCPSFSVAGLKKGIHDERWLWPCVNDAVRVLQPRFVVLENVAAIVGFGDAFGCVLSDLHAAGFDAEWCCVRASDVGAPHRRERWFLVADSGSATSGRQPGRFLATQNQFGSGKERDRFADGCGVSVADSNNGRREQRDTRERRVPVTSPRHVWAQYAPAIERWERVVGEPAPYPVDEQARMNPDLPRWMMGYPQGWLDDVPRTAAIKAAGNGCVEQQAAHALRLLIGAAS